MHITLSQQCQCNCQFQPLGACILKAKTSLLGKGIRICYNKFITIDLCETAYIELLTEQYSLVDRASATETVNLDSIFGLVKPKTTKN